MVCYDIVWSVMAWHGTILKKNIYMYTLCIIYIYIIICHISNALYHIQHASYIISYIIHHVDLYIYIYICLYMYNYTHTNTRTTYTYEGPLTDLYVKMKNLLRSCEIEFFLNDVHLDGYDISPVFISRGWECTALILTRLEVQGF